MCVPEADRHDLFTKLKELLGDDRAATMMELTPPVGWGDVAQRSDLVALRSDIEAVNHRLDALDRRLDLELRALEDRVIGQFGQLTFRLLSAQVALAGVIVAAIALT